MSDFSDAIRRRIRPFGAPKPPPPPPPDGPLCRACLSPLEVRFQPGWGDRPGYDIYTCRSAPCALASHTFAAADYDNIDLARYRAAEHAEYRSQHGTSSQGLCASSAAD